MRYIRFLAEIDPANREQVGGKAAGLARLLQAGLPVPDGFCLVTAAQVEASDLLEGEVARQLEEAYQRQGGGPVAVRSSAIAEDGAEASHAGQQATILGVTDVEGLRAAVRHCWSSLESERAKAYRRHLGAGESSGAMAVLVQRMVRAEAAGVLFTQDPADRTGRLMLVEASPGLGDAVVSGRVNPDRYRLDRENGSITSSEAPAACLDAGRLTKLADLGRRVEALFGEPQDIEWAWADGQWWLLQARPITAPSAAERERARREEIDALRARAAPGGTAWSRHGLAEVLPAPTPMTWSLMQRLLSGEGGFGLAYGDLGFRPEPILAREGCYDLICGRPYCNLTREPLMYAHGLPLEHPYKHLKAHPENASTSRPVLNQARMGPRFWLQFPLQFLRSLFGWLRLHHVRRNLVELLNEHVFPQFDELTAQEAGEDLGPLPSSALMDRLQEWARLTLVEFARHGLKPAILAEITLQHVGRAIAHSLGRDRARGATVRLATGVRLDPATDLAAALRRVARGECTQDDFLNQFGHRCWNELELSQPRWAEDPGALAGMLSDRTEEPVAESATGDTLAEIAVVAGLKAAQREALADTVRDLQTYLALREAAKHRLVKGLAAVRRCLVELDRRYDLRGGIFFLTVADLPRLLAGEDLRPLIRERRRRRAAVLALDVPTVLFSDDLEAIGRPPARPDANSFFGIPLSAGVAEGPALVLYEPDQAGAVADGFILVCPSTDPAWVPLMIRARGLVVETGGVLSHGAIVARELGLPAVGALTYATQVLHDGKHLRVDGTAGTVTVLDQ